MDDHKNERAARQLLPRPTYDNSLLLSFTCHMPEPPSPEMDYLLQQFDGGLYARFMLSTFITLDMAWHCEINRAENYIDPYKRTIDKLVSKADTYGIDAHAIFIFGGSRKSEIYNDAKTEDIRNAQWYSDNNLASQKQIPENTMNMYAYTTFSRYARKLRLHLEAKIKAAFEYLTDVQQKNPRLYIVVSGPGEAELNCNRMTTSGTIQEFYCDFSPFAVLEFRDWIKHEGMYGSGGQYDGEGYKNGGSVYRGANGLTNFNNAFGTAFNSWDLKYYNWSLSDPVDTNFKDTDNPDPNSIPSKKYKFGAMMPQSGSNYIKGGFDPPRVMKSEGKDPFWDLFATFREITVHNYTRDMTAVIRASGFPGNHCYTHQGPEDYLWGTRPNDPDNPLDYRYYAGASPMWTAKTFSDTGMGLTMYDINFITRYARTTQYSIPVLAEMSTNWGLMEYNPEVVFTDNIEDINTVDAIYPWIKRLYDYNIHVLSFFKWETSDLRFRFKGNNREYAVKKFFDAVKDKARLPVETVFIPSAVLSFKGSYDKTGDSVSLSWSSKIWEDLKYRWTDWGDFKGFDIFRGYAAAFPCDDTTRIARTTGGTYFDKTFIKAGMVYYKIAAVNINDERGSIAGAGVKVPGEEAPVLTVSPDRLNYGASTAGPVTPPQGITVSNSGSGAMSWTVSADTGWLKLGQTSGVNTGSIEVSVNTAGLPAGTYTGEVTVSAAGAVNSPVIISITLKVYKSGQHRPPFGVMEPAASAGTVSGSIPVTGWALDDIAVESVKIFRKQAADWIFIGDGVFVEGARPDVEAAYITFPNNNRAGWGYMLLTNFLPNGGNGTYELKAVATNVTGQSTELGTRTVVCDNAHAVNPFGTTDTPAQGGIASGSSYVNFGWVLTPQPNQIPKDGSTIGVYIDGINVGHPTYNNYRQDIADAFPGYANSNGAIGYFVFDTRRYINGIHTISWTAKDSGGNIEGIGSRFFIIKN
jgi:hypothetical protein